MPSNWLSYSEKIKPIASKFGSTISYLGSGTEGGVWSIDNNYALKLYPYQKDYWPQPIPELENKVYDFGFLEDKTFWVVKELLDTPQEEDFDFFQEIIFDIASHVEKVVLSREKRNVKCVKRFSKQAYKSFIEKTTIDKQDLEEVRDLYQLKDNWLYQLTIEITYKSLTYRDSDLHAGNLGIRKTDRKLIFFDW